MTGIWPSRADTCIEQAPGTSFAAVPGYAVIFGLERLFGIDPDGGWALNVNAWLSGVTSVGLLAAWGVVLFRRLAMRLSGGRSGASLFATIAFAFGTMVFPYATMLYEHDLVVVALLGAFLLASDPPTPRRLFGAGLCAGGAIVSSYLSVVAAAILGVYVLWRGRRLAPGAAFVAGLLPPLLILAAYNLACFGKVVTTNYAWENPLFNKSGGGLLGLFASAPRWHVLAALTVSPYRGLFSGTPVLVLGLIGLVAMLRNPRVRLEGLLCAAMIAHVFFFNLSFTEWNAGWSCGPRYLIPAIPFLALPIVFVAPRLGPPFARCRSRDGARRPIDRNPRGGRGVIGRSGASTFPAAPRSPARLPANWQDAVIALYVEPVSANPAASIPLWPTFLRSGLAAGPMEFFNAGEFLFPGSRLSLLPWLGLASLFAVLLWRESRGEAHRPV